MVGRFDISNVFSGIDRLAASSSYEIQGPIIPDNRSRLEVREDFERKLKSLDKDKIEDLLVKVEKINNPDEFISLREDIEDSLVKFIRFYDCFEDLNSEESRKVALKEKELKLDARYDWRDKARLFFFRILGSALVVVTLFVIGYVEHEYEWARLPMTKYLNTSTALP